MSWFANKPALVVLFLFVGGIVLARYVSCSPFLLWIGGGVLALACGVFYWRSRSRWFFVVALLAIASLSAGLYRIRAYEFPNNHVKEFTDLPCLVSIEGTVQRPVERKTDRVSTVLSVDSVWVRGQGWPAAGNCLFQIYEPMHELSYGDKIVARGQLRAPAGQRNPWGFDYQKYLAAQDIHALFRVPSAQHVLVLSSGHANAFYARLILPLRSFVLRFIHANFSDDQAALLQALLLGMRGNIDEELRTTFANVGVIHVLAVSGMHVGFIAAVLLGVFGFLRLANPWRTFLVIAGLIVYAHLTGLKPSVVRATVMASVFLVGLLLQRRAHILNILAIAALIILLANPLQLFEPGFQLSFVAVAGIALIYKQFQYLLRSSFRQWREHSQTLRLWLVSLFFVSLAAQLATLPLTMYYFGRIPVISLLANLVVVPLVGALISLGFVAVCFMAIHTAVGSAFANTIWVLLSLLTLIISAAEHIPFAYFKVPHMPFEWFLIYSFGLLTFIFWHRIRARNIFIMLMLLLANVSTWKQVVDHKVGLTVTFFDVGQGDAALIECPNGKTLLVDTGDCTEYFDCGKDIILPYLQRAGISHLDALVLTHPHADHIGGAASILQGVRVKRVVAPAVEYESEFYTQIDSLRIGYNIPIQHVLKGDTLLLDNDVLLLVLHPTARFVERISHHPAELNDVSIVLKCIYQQYSILLAGDAEIPSERGMQPYGDLLQSTILKLGHHGSSTASGEAFRKSVDPQIGIVSVGKFNRFGLPSDNLLTTFENQGTQILRTDEHGAIQFHFTASTMRRLR